MSTPSEGPKPRQERVTRAPANPVVGERAQLALAGTAWVVVVVPADPAVERVVGWAVGADDRAEDAGAAVWSAVPEVQPVTARAATKTAVAMIRTGRMVTPSNDHGPVGLGHQPRLSRSQHGHRWASRPPRTGLCSVAMLHPTKHAAHPQWVAGARRRPSPGQALTSQRPRLEPRAPIPRWGAQKGSSVCQAAGRCCGPRTTVPGRPLLPEAEGSATRPRRRTHRSGPAPRPLLGSRGCFG
jgi:hypothetical protein